MLCEHVAYECSQWLRVHVSFCVRTWLVICFTDHVLVLVMFGEHMAFHVMFPCAMCSPVYCLAPPILLPVSFAPPVLPHYLIDYLPHLSSLITSFVCSPYLFSLCLQSCAVSLSYVPDVFDLMSSQVKSIQVIKSFPLQGSFVCIFVLSVPCFM